MKKIIQRISVFVLVLLLVMAGGCTKPAKVTANVADIAKYGHLILDITGAELFDSGYEYGDLLEITVAGKTWEMPLCSNYNDVDTGVNVLRASSAEAAVVLALNMGNFATTAGIATKTQIDEDPGYRWDYLIQTPVKLEITLKEKGAYREQWLARQLERTNAREDYPHLSDEEFANFRAVDTTGMGQNKLYRSSSPINPGIGRNTYADEAAKEAGILTVINLADSSNVYDVPEDAYYNSCQVTYLNLGTEFLSEEATSSLARGMRFIINGEGPYLLHCNEGKDRAGFVSAVLECLMGASIDEVVEDYMVTYINYYGVEKGTEKYTVIVNNNIIQLLNTTFKVSDVYKADLVSEAEAYMMDDLGLSADEVATLKAKLGP